MNDETRMSRSEAIAAMEALAQTPAQDAESAPAPHFAVLGTSDVAHPAAIPNGNVGDRIVAQIAANIPDASIYHSHCDIGATSPDQPGVARRQYGLPDWIAHKLPLCDGLAVTIGHANSKPFHEYTELELLELIYADLTLPLLCAQAYVQARGARGGDVVLIGSYAHDHVLSHSVAYCAAKAGLNHAVRCLAWDYRGEFRFNIVNPYHIEGTPMSGAVKADMKRSGRFNGDAEIDAYRRKDLAPSDSLLDADAVALHAFRLLTDTFGAHYSGQPFNLYQGVR